MNIITPRKLIRMARKWHNLAALQRKRISLDVDRPPEKGHFILYTVERRRFSLPIAYLNTWIFRELFRMSEEEFGLPTYGPIRLPCDSQFLSFVVSLMEKKAATDVLDKALLLSMSSCRSCSSSFYRESTRNVPLVPCGCS